MIARLQERARTRGPWPLVLALGMGVFVGGFDQTFIVPVLSSILDDFDVPIDEFGSASWVVNGYLLGYVVALPVMGRVADVYGQFRVFVAALGVFMAGSVLVALAPNLPLMAAARALTAIGGGALVPIALAVAADRLRPRDRALGLASVSTLDDASTLLGPLWGTAIGVWIGWRGLFWLNIALALPVLIAVVVLAAGQRVPRGGRVDWPGAILLTASLTLFAFALADVAAEPRPVGQTLALYASALALAAAFVLWELRADEPLVDLRMFRVPAVAATFGIFLLEGGALITALVNIPLMAELLQDRDGAGPGLLLMRMVLFMVLGGVAGALLTGRIGVRWTVVAGLVLTASGLLLIRAWPEEPSEAAIWATLAVAGFGFTLSDAPLYLVIAERVSEARRVSAMALLQSVQTLGMLVGMALLASQGLGRFDQRAEDLFASGSEQGLDAATYRALIHRTFDETLLAAAAAVAAAALIAAVFLRVGRPATEVRDPLATLVTRLRRRRAGT